VVRWFDPDEPVYISVKDGVRTTSEDLPAWADPSDVIEMATPPPPGKELLTRLQHLEEELAQQQPERHRIYRMSEVVSAVEQRYEDADVAESVTLAEFAASEDLLDARRDTPFDLAVFERASDYALQEYSSLNLSGNGARSVFAIYALMGVAGSLAEEAVTVAKRQLRQLLTEDSSPPGTRLVLSLYDLRSWVDAFEAVTAGRAWIPAASAGRICLSRGDHYRDLARRQPTFEQFHRSLHVALAFYRAAARVFAVVENAGPGRVRPAVFEEAIDRQRTCEEMRVRIEVSLGWAVDVNPMGYNLTYPQRLEAWALSLLHESADRTPAEIYHLSSQLAFPDVVRELAFALLDLAQGRPERAAQRSIGVMGRMEADLPPVLEWGRSYFAYCADLARTSLRMLGREEEARGFDQRLDAEWIRQHMSYDGAIPPPSAGDSSGTGK
jgi:hypothetical protein